MAFKPGEIGGIKLKNRLVRSATFENMATEDGKVTEIQVELCNAISLRIWKLGELSKPIDTHAILC